MPLSAIRLHPKLPAAPETPSVQVTGAMSHPGDTQVAGMAVPEGQQPLAVLQNAQGVANPPVAAAQTSLPPPQNSIKNQLLGASQQQPLNGSYLTPSSVHAQPGMQVLLTFWSSSAARHASSQGA